jgi:UPF0755 protein
MKKIKIVLIVLLVGAGVASYLGMPYLKLFFASQENTINDKDVELFVPTGTNCEGLIDLLVNQGIIKNKKNFELLTEYKELSDSLVAPGKYIISPSFPLKYLVNGFKKNALGNGNAEIEVNVTFNNCRDLYDLAGKVSKFIEVDSVQLVDYLTSSQTINHYGFKYETFGALFIPNTYRMFWDTDSEQFVNRMAEEFKLFWNDERKQKAKQLNLSQSQIVTLASIVYKEQGVVKEEWPIIAGLYLNRVRDNWKLESDPTFRFCWGRRLDGVQRLTNEHKSIDCPYNTYMYAGLPPGPICIPPSGVVDAVLNAAKHNYYFMCAKVGGENKHNFAHSYNDHLNNARSYQKWLTANRIR